MTDRDLENQIRVAFGDMADAVLFKAREYAAATKQPFVDRDDRNALRDPIYRRRRTARRCAGGGLDLSGAVG